MATTPKRPSALHNRAGGYHTLVRELRAIEHEHQERWLATIGDAGAALREWRASIVSDLGGEESLSAMELAIVDMIVRSHLLVCSIDRYLLSLPSPVNRQRHQAFPIVLQRQQLVDSLARNLERLGLKRRAKALPSLQEYLASKGAPENEAPQGEASP